MFKNKIVKNASWMIGCKIAKAVLSFLLMILTARYLGPSNYGLVSYAASIILFVEPVAQLGLRDIQVHELIGSPKKEGEILGTSLFLTLCASLVTMACVVLFVSVVNAGEPTTILFCTLYCLLLIVQAGGLFQYWFQAKYLMKDSALVCLAAYFLVSVYRFFLLAARKKIYWFAFSNSLDLLLIGMTLLFIYYRKGGQKLKVSFPLAGTLFKKSRYFIIPNLMISIFSQTDRIMIKLMTGDANTGFYSAAVTCASLGNFVFLAMIDAVRPLIFESRKTDRALYETRLAQLYSVIIYGSLAMSLGMTLFAPLIISLAYGRAYMEAASVLRLVVWFTTFSYIGSVNGIWILSEEKQNLLWLINLSGALANIGLNYVLIPTFGIKGAAIASLATQCVSNVGMITALKATRPLTGIMLRALKPWKLFGKDR